MVNLASKKLQVELLFILIVIIKISQKIKNTNKIFIIFNKNNFQTIYKLFKNDLKII